MKFLTMMVMCVSVALAGCTKTLEGLDTSIQKALTENCGTGERLYADFKLVSVTGVIPERYVDRVDSAYEGIKSLCDNPSEATVATVLAKMATLYLAIRQAKEAS